MENRRELQYIDITNAENLKSCLRSCGKHSGYQALPPSIMSDDPDLGKLSGTKYQDHLRYEWLKQSLIGFDGKVVDIGANIGYFS